MKTAMTLVFSLVCVQSALAQTAESQQDSTVTQQTTVKKSTSVETLETVQTVTKVAPKAQQSVAIFVLNRGGAKMEAYLPVMEDFVTAQVAGRGFSLIAKETLMGSRKEAEKGGFNYDDQTILSLSRDVGADYALVVTLAQLGQITKKLDDPRIGLNEKNLVSSLDATFKLIELKKGAAIKAGMVNAFKVSRADADAGSVAEIDAVTGGALLTDAATQISEKIADLAVATPAKLDSGLIEIELNCSVDGLTIPEILKKDGTWVVGSKTSSAVANDVVVEVDGIMVGTAGGSLSVRPGLHKLRLSREGYVELSRFVNFIPGQRLNLSLAMTPATHARHAQDLLLLQGLKAGQILTEAEASRLVGLADFYKNSKVSFDLKVDEKKNSDSRKNIEVKKVDD
ncbi:MAG: hypothetical protein RL095_1562 [Verrucomicrobiota bacterium]